MWASEIRDEELTPELIDRLLFSDIEDRGANADCVIVLGSHKAMNYRVPKAVELYQAGRADKIMMCGGITSTTPGRTVSEADHMCLKALDMGIPDEAIIVENFSNNTIENILCSMLMLQRTFWLNKVKRVIIVTASFHMKRSLLLARYFYPKHIEICACPADDLYTTSDAWMNTAESIETVTYEAKNLLMYLRNGVIPDIQI